MDEIESTSGQSIIDGTLRWHRSGVATNGSPFEEDGLGLPPDDVRCQLIERDGEWEVLVDDSVNKAAVVRVLRETMKVDMVAAAKLLKNLPGVVYTGTKTEAEWICAKLIERGVPSETRLNQSC